MCTIAKLFSIYDPRTKPESESGKDENNWDIQDIQDNIITEGFNVEETKE